MNSHFFKANKRIFEWIRDLDPAPIQARPVTFWFYSESEIKIYRLASRLENNGYKVIFCDEAVNGDYLCIAERIMSPDNEQVSRLCLDMHILAEQTGVLFDGWETQIEPEE